MSEEEKIKAALKKNGAREYLTTLAAGVPVTVLKDNKVVKIYPDGREEVLPHVE